MRLHARWMERSTHLRDDILDSIRAQIREMSTQAVMESEQVEPKAKKDARHTEEQGPCSPQR